MAKIIDFLAQFEAMHLFMPSEQHEINKLPRAWVINVGATVVGQPFVDWVSKRIATRNEEMAKDRNLLIKMDPQLAQAFQRSTAISTSNGNAAHMLKQQVSKHITDHFLQSKRRRTKAQLDADKAEAAD